MVSLIGALACFIAILISSYEQFQQKPIPLIIILALILLALLGRPYILKKMVVEKCIKKSDPVKIATQMMESMIINFRPTSTEANDVANAVLDGADALMLSGETSVGKYPVETISSMQKIIEYTENKGKIQVLQHEPDKSKNIFHLILFRSYIL